MPRHKQSPKGAWFAIATAVLLSATATILAQSLKDLQTPKSPLVLKAQGSFFVGGESVDQSALQVSFGPAGHITVNQMYVRYMVPVGGEKNPPSS